VETGSTSYFATTAKGVESVLAGELSRLGARAVVVKTGGVAFSGDRELLYRANLWLRSASRVLVPLAEFMCVSERELYDTLRQVPWHAHLTPEMTLAVDANVRDSILTHSHYAALRVKDAIVDSIRDRVGARPSVDTRDPDVRVNVRLFRNHCTVSLDASGTSLHERGYRKEGGAAPLKETLAAAIVALSGWRPEQPLVNPMCGSGTLAIEAALAAGDVAPGLVRGRFGCERWRDSDAGLMRRLRAEARARREGGVARLHGPILASDGDGKAVALATANVRAAGVDRWVRVARADVRAVRPPPAEPGVLLLNPPYGERLGDRGELGPLYTAIGDLLKHHFTGWSAYILVGQPALAKQIGLRTARRIPLWNGPIECRLLAYSLY
jgi:putative N6-adenine-specific DNA methylase